MSSFESGIPKHPALNELGTGSDDATPITMSTIIQFLCGSRAAILKLATRRDTFWLGLVLVISAGFVREYDRSDLLQNPWLVLRPLIASVGLSLVLFPLVEFVARRRGATGGGFWGRFRTFVSLLWMTAPLAWIFILPVERVMSADEATITNLWFLGVVNLWRVVLVARLLAVLYVPRADEMVITGTIFLVRVLVDTLSICYLGGDRLVMMVGNNSGTLPGAFIVIRVLSLFAILGVVTWPVWFVATLAVAFWEGAEWSWAARPMASPQPISRGVKLLAAASLLIWVVLLPLTQPEHQRRFAQEQIRRSQAAHETASDDVGRSGGETLKRR